MWLFGSAPTMTFTGKTVYLSGFRTPLYFWLILYRKKSLRQAKISIQCPYIHQPAQPLCLHYSSVHF